MRTNHNKNISDSNAFAQMMRRTVSIHLDSVNIKQFFHSVLTPKCYSFSVLVFFFALLSMKKIKFDRKKWCVYAMHPMHCTIVYAWKHWTSISNRRYRRLNKWTATECRSSYKMKRQCESWVVNRAAQSINHKPL